MGWMLGHWAGICQYAENTGLANPAVALDRAASAGGVIFGSADPPAPQVEKIHADGLRRRPA